MVAVGDKAGEARGRFGDRIRLGDAEDVEAFAPGVGDELGLDRRRF